jgi:hypothetical protein
METSAETFGKDQRGDELPEMGHFRADVIRGASRADLVSDPSDLGRVTTFSLRPLQ